jgi:ABC-type polysaccharide/polyol phosphate transport system ATPase subunit
MSSEIVVDVGHLGKCFQIYARPEDRLKQILWRGRRQFHRDFWALQDVTLHIHRGETFGIVGRNGSGKSTLLQLISGTLTPTRGYVHINGQIAALLELGAGFNPEFTGRENVYMNATLLGLSRDEIDNRYPAIVAFAEIGDFVDQPVKTYSSGMYLRLAFAVAAHVDTQILIIDEALSVGDLLFQFKCFLKFQELQALGRTILFVSHDMNVIKKYCSRAALLENGHLLYEGTPNDVVNRYTKLLFPESGQTAERDTEVGAPPSSKIQTSEREYRYGSREGEIAEISLRNASGDFTTLFTSGEQMSVSFRVVARRAIDRPILAMTIKDVKGQEVYVTNTYYKGVDVPQLRPGDELQITFEQHLNLIANRYFLSLGFVYFEGGTIVPMDRRYDVVEITVLARDGDLSLGIANLRSEIAVKSVRRGVVSLEPEGPEGLPA